MRSRRHLAATGNGHPLARNGLLLHDERDELPLGSTRLDLAELVRTRELLVQRAAPSERSGDGIRVGRDVVAVQWVRDLETERVARTEPARHCAACDDSVPQGGTVVRHRQQLATVLAGVPVISTMHWIPSSSASET